MIRNVFFTISVCFVGLTSTKQRIKSLAQGNNKVPLVRLKPTIPQSQVQHSTTELHHLFEIQNQWDKLLLLVEMGAF